MSNSLVPRPLLAAFVKMATGSGLGTRLHVERICMGALLTLCCGPYVPSNDEERIMVVRARNPRHCTHHWGMWERVGLTDWDGRKENWITQYTNNHHMHCRWSHNITKRCRNTLLTGYYVQVYISSSEEERKCSKDYSYYSHHWGMWNKWDSPTEEAGRRKQQHAYNATNHEHIPMC